MKVVKNAQEACKDIFSGASIMLGGFGLCGIPENCIDSIKHSGINNLTCISNNAGVDDFGIGMLLHQKQVKKMISSYVGENKEFERQMLTGELDVDLMPQGTLAEKIRCGGAGIPAFYTPAGIGTEVAVGKEHRIFNGKEYLMELALNADFSLIKAWKGDTEGNLIFKGTAQNFNSMMAKAGKVVIAEVEELVEAGQLDPNTIHVPGIYVHRIFQGVNYEKRIEKRTIHVPNVIEKHAASSGIGLSKEQIAQRIAQELKNGDYVNLGIGIPTLVSNYLPDNTKVVLQAENGLLGIGPFPNEYEVDPDLINASKQTITMEEGASVFDSAESFAMIRGGHVDVTVLGAMEVSENGDIANWKIPGKMIKGMGGAMDLVASAKNIIVAMQHVSKDGHSKLLTTCDLPITGIRCVKKIVTELAVLEIAPEGGFILVERAPGVTVQQIKDATLGKLIINGEIPKMKF